jgi:hypothetical protein
MICVRLFKFAWFFRPRPATSLFFLFYEQHALIMGGRFEYSHFNQAQGGWRNTLVFDPTAKYGKWSYEEAIIQPLADAAAAAASSGTQIEFTPQGEMGATVYFHPEEWREVLERTRTRMESARRDAGTEGPTLVGLGANNFKACGCIGVGIVEAWEYLDYFKTQGFDASIYPQGMDAIRDAFLAGDYISISAYMPMLDPEFEACDL